MAYAAKILKDSLSPDNVRLTSIEVTFPRIVLAEFNTHRVFSRNSASSRAIPVAKMLQKVKDDPFIPIYFGKNQKGMQASEELDVEAQARALKTWLRARNAAVLAVKRLQMPDIDLHKQIANRLLEPWLWHTVIVTSTEWDNYLGLRCNPMAQPEIKRAADMMRDLLSNSSPCPMNYREWHLPLIDDEELFNLQVGGVSMEDICKISAGRCARISYLTHDGRRDFKADIELCNSLMKNGHMSPLEHVARPMMQSDAHVAVQRCDVPEFDTFDMTSAFCGNLRGWVQMRKEVPNEDNFSKVVGG